MRDLADHDVLTVALATPKKTNETEFWEYHETKELEVVRTFSFVMWLPWSGELNLESWVERTKQMMMTLHTIRTTPVTFEENTTL